MTETRVGHVARLLGFAGLAPALASMLFVASGEPDAVALVAFYALLILSFLGGIWWGFAMRGGERQAPLVAIAVVPSLTALTLGIGAVFSLGSPWSLVAIGVALMLTLPVDRYLTNRGMAPADWMALRIPLSTGLAAATIATAILVAR